MKLAEERRDLSDRGGLPCLWERLSVAVIGLMRRSENILDEICQTQRMEFVSSERADGGIGNVRPWRGRGS